MSTPAFRKREDVVRLWNMGKRREKPKDEDEDDGEGTEIDEEDTAD